MCTIKSNEYRQEVAIEEGGEEKKEQVIQVDEAKGNVKMGCATFFTVFKKIWILCGSLSFVRLEYK